MKLVFISPKLLRYLLVAFIGLHLFGCSSAKKLSGITGSSKAMRVSVISGSPLPQVADNVGSVGKLKIYIMNEENTYRKDIVQEVDVDYRVPSKLQREKMQIASVSNKMVRQPLAYSTNPTRPVKPRASSKAPVKISVYKGGEASKVVTIEPLSNIPVTVPELSLLEPRVNVKNKAPTEYLAIKELLNNSKSIKRKRVHKKAKPKKREYNYFKPKKENFGEKETKKQNYKKSHKRVKKLHPKKNKWMWDKNGKIIRS